MMVRTQDPSSCQPLVAARYAVVASQHTNSVLPRRPLRIKIGLSRRRSSGNKLELFLWAAPHLFEVKPVHCLEAVRDIPITRTPARKP